MPIIRHGGVLGKAGALNHQDLKAVSLRYLCADRVEQVQSDTKGKGDAIGSRRPSFSLYTCFNLSQDRHLEQRTLRT